MSCFFGGFQTTFKGFKVISWAAAEKAFSVYLKKKEWENLISKEIFSVLNKSLLGGRRPVK